MPYRISCLLLFPGACVAFAAPNVRLAEEAILVPPTAATPEDQAIRRWQQRLGDGQAGRVPLERLGWAFVAKARATHDDSNYTLALLSADVLASRHGVDGGERLLRGHVALNLHRFAEAEAIARELIRTNDQPRAQALLSDALLEQGRIEEAIVACDRFVAAQPGLEGYARVAHLRWLKGDLWGAHAAMEAAARASSQRDDESGAWTLVRLADYELQLDRADRALALSEAVLGARPDYPPALLVRGQALLALGRGADAIIPLAAAAEQVAEPMYQWWLADAQRAAGHHAAAVRTEAKLTRHAARSDPRTFALYLATRGQDAARAVSLARRELDVRADPLTLDALAWALCAAGDRAAADAAMQRALAGGTGHARLYLHAATIARTVGRAGEARQWLARAAAGAAALMPSERERFAAEHTAVSGNLSQNIFHHP